MTPAPVYATDRVQLYAGDCLDVLPTLGDATVDAVVTDPPYGLSREPDMREVLRHWLAGDDYQHRGGGFMGKTWDAFVPGPATWRECYRVMKPGAHLLAFGGTRTWDMLMLAIRLAGFEVRDTIADLTGRHAAALLWVQGAGFPKSLDVGKAIDKNAGHWRGRAGEVVSGNGSMSGGNYERTDKGEPITPAATAWRGWHTALKPAHEPIVVARKPLAGTVAQNVLTHGTGALNVDGCRVGTSGGGGNGLGSHFDRLGNTEPLVRHGEDMVGSVGRWPANVVLSGDAAEEMDRQSGTLTSGKMKPTHTTAGVDGRASAYGKDAAGGFTTMETYGDTGGASRFFPVFRYEPKADNDERVTIDGVSHPTVKPLALTRWLIRLITPPGGTVLDPFTGTGTTLEAAALEHAHGIGIERDPTYIPLATARLTRRHDPATYLRATRHPNDPPSLFDAAEDAS